MATRVANFFKDFVKFNVDLAGQYCGLSIILSIVERMLLPQSIVMWRMCKTLIWINVMYVFYIFVKLLYDAYLIMKPLMRLSKEANEHTDDKTAIVDYGLLKLNYMYKYVFQEMYLIVATRDKESKIYAYIEKDGECNWYKLRTRIGVYGEDDNVAINVCWSCNDQNGISLPWKEQQAIQRAKQYSNGPIRHIMDIMDPPSKLEWIKDIRPYIEDKE